MIYVLGIDPGRVSGYALVELPDAGRARVIRLGSAKHLPYRDVCAELAVLVDPGARRHMAIEGQFVASRAEQSKAQTAKDQDALLTASAAGSWREAGTAQGWEVLPPIMPSTWRSKALSPWWKPTMTGDECKALALRAALGIYGVDIRPQDHHIAEALLIAGYAAEVLRHDKAVRR